ncbi:MAG: hypothetical protein HKL95_02280, partial [Phycisphaerae bacterium]|nr:hypothetical protein [Phycisphaerae bacterium]
MTDTITNTCDEPVMPPESAPEVANELSLVVENPFLLAKLLGFTINLLGMKNFHVDDDDFFELTGYVLTRPTVVKMVRATCSEAVLKEFQSSDIRSERLNLQRDNAQ